MITTSNTTHAPEPFAGTGVYLGPGKVGTVGRDKVELVFPDQSVWAQLALAVPYTPVKGDTVLVISQQEQWYVIGVLEGRGTTSFTAPSDIEFRAPNGEIRMQAANGVRLKGQQVGITTNKLTVSADQVVEKFGNVKRQVKEKYQLVAKNLKTIVSDTFRLSGKRVIQRAEEDMKIDGNQIRLG